MNVMTPALFLTAILTMLWPHVHGTGALVALALLYGATVGSFAALISLPMIALGDSTDVGRRTGMYLTVLSLGSLAGPPISGAINRATGGYSVVGIYAGLFFVFRWTPNLIGADGCSTAFYFCSSPCVLGSTMMVGLVLLVLSRYFVLRKWNGKA